MGSYKSDGSSIATQQQLIGSKHEPTYRKNVKKTKKKGIIIMMCTSINLIEGNILSNTVTKAHTTHKSNKKTNHFILKMRRKCFALVPTVITLLVPLTLADFENIKQMLRTKLANSNFDFS